MTSSRLTCSSNVDFRPLIGNFIASGDWDCSLLVCILVYSIDIWFGRQILPSLFQIINFDDHSLAGTAYSFFPCSPHRSRSIFSLIRSQACAVSSSSSTIPEIYSPSNLTKTYWFSRTLAGNSSSDIPRWKLPLNVILISCYHSTRPHSVRGRRPNCCQLPIVTATFSGNLTKAGFTASQTQSRPNRANTNPICLSLA